MPTVHLLNLDNDGALATARAAYTPNAPARALEHDLSLLPALWASPGDYIIAPASKETCASDGNDHLIRRLMEQKGVRVYHGERDVTAASPWGWSLNARLRMRHAGVPEGLLPDDPALDRHRMMSHRRTALQLSDALGRRGFPSPNMPVEMTDTKSLLNLLDTHDRLILKRPWSCSGRGVFPLSHLSHRQAVSLGEGIIRRQGSVMAEIMLDRRADFSALLHSDGSGVELHGWSLFQTSPEGRYEGSVIASQDYIVERLKVLGCDTAVLGRALTEELPPLTAGYRGWLSVDMLATTDGRIAPCIEINLRRTMGVTAHLTAAALEMAATAEPMLLTVSGAGSRESEGERVIAGGCAFKMSVKPLL